MTERIAILYCVFSRFLYLDFVTMLMLDPTALYIFYPGRPTTTASPTLSTQQSSRSRRRKPSSSPSRFLAPSLCLRVGNWEHKREFCWTKKRNRTRPQTNAGLRCQNRSSDWSAKLHSATALLQATARRTASTIARTIYSTGSVVSMKCSFGSMAGLNLRRK